MGCAGGLEQADNSRGGENYSNPEYILKVEQMQSAEGLDTGCERKRGVKGSFEFFGLSNWKGEIVAYLCGERPGLESLSVSYSDCDFGSTA